MKKAINLYNLKSLYLFLVAVGISSCDHSLNPQHSLELHGIGRIQGFGLSQDQKLATLTAATIQPDGSFAEQVYTLDLDTQKMTTLYPNEKIPAVPRDGAHFEEGWSVSSWDGKTVNLLVRTLTDCSGWNCKYQFEIWDLTTYARKLTIDSPGVDRVFNIFNYDFYGCPNGKRLIFYDQIAGLAKVWDLETQNLLFSQPSYERLSAASFTSQCDLVPIVTQSSGVKVFQIGTAPGSEKETISMPDTSPKDFITLTDRGIALVVPSTPNDTTSRTKYSCEIHKWNLQTKMEQNIKQPDCIADQIVVSPEQTKVAFLSYNSDATQTQVWVLDTNTLQFVSHWQVDYAIIDFVFPYEGNRCLIQRVWKDDDRLELRDLDDGTLRAQLGSAGRLYDQEGARLAIGNRYHFSQFLLNGDVISQASFENDILGPIAKDTVDIWDLSGI